ncbi:MAG: dihydroneopterin aldolase [Bacteroidia bacterium]|jgi:dihydroneopterin aldolase
MDTVYIKGLRVETIIGIHDWERLERQTLVLDLEMGCDTSRPASSDSIDYALDYAKVSEQIIALVEQSNHQLIETVAEEVARMLTRGFNIPWLRLTVSKPAALAAAEDVGVVIERDRRQK